MVERTLSASSSAEYKKIIEVLKANAGRIIENWAHESSRSAFLKGADLNVPEEVRIERLRVFYQALVAKADNPTSKIAQEMLRSAIRAEHARSSSLSGMVKKQNLLRDTMLYVVEHDLPDLPRATAKMALDAIIDRGIEATAETMEEYGEMRGALSRSLPGMDETFSLDQALARFCRSAMDYFDSDFVALFRYNPDMRDLVCLACSAKGLALTKDSSVMLESFPAAAQAIAQRKTAYVGEATGEPSKKRNIIGRLAFAHTICAPMTRGEQVAGVLLIGDSSKTMQFTPDEVGLAEDMSKQVSRVLENSELFKALSIRSRAQKVLIDTAASLQQEIESEEIYRIVATRLSELVPCNELAFYVFDWRKHVCNPVYATGPYAAETMADREFSADAGVVGYVGKSRKAEVVPDVEDDPRAEYIPGTPKTHTRMLAVPVIGQKEVIGVIELLKYAPDKFSREDLEIAILFANHASVALENAKLFNELTSVRDQIELHMDLLTHDIANYTTPIMAYFEALKKRRDLDPQVASVVERTSQQAESIMRLIEMVRTISKLREGPPKLLKKMDLRKAIESAIEDVKQFGDSKGVGFEVSLPEDAMLVLADDLLKDIFVNLFYSIALTEQKEPTKLSISAEERKERKMVFWWIKVAQPTRAIPPNLKGDVLRMVKTSKSELAGGFGIGMAAAKGIIDRYSGSMWVGDIVPGDYTKGCVFNMLLPKSF
jgi:GAF domain-containing protein